MNLYYIVAYQACAPILVCGTRTEKSQSDRPRGNKCMHIPYTYYTTPTTHYMSRRDICPLQPSIGSAKCPAGRVYIYNKNGSCKSPPHEVAGGTLEYPIYMQYARAHSLQIVELADVLPVNSTSVRLDWQLYVSRSEQYIEVSGFGGIFFVFFLIRSGAWDVFVTHICVGRRGRIERALAQRRQLAGLH